MYSMQLLQKTADRFRIITKNQIRIISAFLLAAAGICYYAVVQASRPSPSNSSVSGLTVTDTATSRDSVSRAPLTLDTITYNKLLMKITNGDSSGRWPVKTTYPMAGAILPFKRIVAYYGNFYSKKMGILGEYPAEEMLSRLKADVKKWQMADSTTEVQAALHYIAVTAQGAPGKGNKYRLRMPFKQIDSVIRLAARINAIVFLDVQVGQSNVQEELPLLANYLKMPQVHLGIDPEFSMKTGKKPGSVIGTMDATDVNFAIHYLADLATANQLPPKILVVHRFTHAMLTNYRKIELNPNVQVVMDMDGWGSQSRKLSSYEAYIYKEPVEFTGFKLFYKNDYREPKSRMMTPEEVIRLKPQPMYIQYQ
jgi:hypothetical protein